MVEVLHWWVMNGSLQTLEGINLPNTWIWDFWIPALKENVFLLLILRFLGDGALLHDARKMSPQDFTTLAPFELESPGWGTSRTVPCIVGCLAACMTSIYWMSIAPVLSPPVALQENILSHY